jgi:uncharacterized membrane protein
MNGALFLSVVCMVVWLVFVFVAQISAGWIHVALVASVLLLVKAIVDGPSIKSPNSKT